MVNPKVLQGAVLGGVLLIIGVALLFISPAIPQVIGDQPVPWQVLSVSQVPVINEGTEFIVLGRGSAGNDFLEGGLESTEFRDSSGNTVEGDLIISYQELKKECVYPMTMQQSGQLRVLKKIDTKYTSWWGGCLDTSCLAQACKTENPNVNTLDWVFIVNYPVNDRVDCYAYKDEYWKGIFQRLKLNYEAKATVYTTNDVTNWRGYATLTESQDFAVFEDNLGNSNSIGSIEWAGNLLGKEMCPMPTGTLAMRQGTPDSGDWVLVEEAKWDEYPTYLTQLESCLRSYSLFAGGDQYGGGASSCIVNFNSRVYGIETSGLSQGNVFNDALFDTSNNQMFLDASQMFFVQVKMNIKALWLGIRKVNPKAELISCPGRQVLPSGSTRYSAITFKNVGDAGNFVVSQECSGAVASLQSSSEGIFINAGESKTVTLEVRGTNTGSNQAEGSCTVYARSATSVDEVSCVNYFGVDPECSLTALDCAGNFDVDYDSCSCICSITSCPDGYYLNPTLCECQALTPTTTPVPCPSKSYFDTEQNRCVCTDSNEKIMVGADGVAYCGSTPDPCPPGTSRDASGVCVEEDELPWIWVALGIGAILAIALLVWALKGKRKR